MSISYVESPVGRRALEAEGNTLGAHGTPFQKGVGAMTSAIPFGETATYGGREGGFWRGQGLPTRRKLPALEGVILP